MERIAFFDAKPYDKVWFDKANTKYDIRYYESRLCPENAKLAEGCTAVCAFVNDVINAQTIDKLYELGVKVLLMRCAGFNNIALSAAKGKLKILRVPAYSPYAVAEHAMGLLLALNRKIPRAICRTRDFNFSLVGLTGFDLHGKTAGIIGTGKIGRVFIDIYKGFGMKVSRRLRKTEAYTMKKNIFAETYAQVQELKKQYNAAKDAEDEAGMQAARGAYNLLMGSISTAGEISVRIYRLYEEARDCGNEYIDFHEVVWDKDVAGMIGALRENGISHFTFSSGWSGAVDTAWLFTQNGCRLEGLVEINSPHKVFGSEEYEKAHGYLFSIG